MDRIEARTNKLVRELCRAYGLSEKTEIDKIERDSEEAVQQQIDAEIEQIVRDLNAGERGH